MWETRIELDAKNPEKVIVTALYIGDDNFSYSETILIQDFNVKKFVQTAIAKRDKFLADQNRVREIAKPLSEEILTALNKADGVKDVVLSVTADKGVIQCAKYVEEVEIIEMVK
jgi:hypothetical protein